MGYATGTLAPRCVKKPHMRSLRHHPSSQLPSRARVGEARRWSEWSWSRGRGRGTVPFSDSQAGRRFLFFLRFRFPPDGLHMDWGDRAKSMAAGPRFLDGFGISPVSKPGVQPLPQEQAPGRPLHARRPTDRRSAPSCPGDSAPTSSAQPCQQHQPHPTAPTASASPLVVLPSLNPAPPTSPAP